MGKAVVDHPFEKVMEMLHGEKNTTVKLSLSARTKGQPHKTILLSSNEN